MTELSPATQLAVLLTARWSVNGAKPLSPSEFNQVRLSVGRSQDDAARMLSREADLTKLGLDPDRIGGLLNRGLGVFQSVDKWVQAGIWILSWADENYPSRFKQLKLRAPVLIFGYGDPNAFTKRALAIVGARNADEDRLNKAAEVGRACSESGITVVSGGARGVDTRAMEAGIVGKGTVVGVLADSLLKESGKRVYREAIQEGRMCLMSEVHPEARFDVGNAMARNRLAYACAEAALVVECDPQKGGTWAGALEALKEGKAVYVLKGARAERELVSRGAILIDMPFALQPQRLIEGERPQVEVPPSRRVAATVRKLLGDPLKPLEELEAYFLQHSTEIIAELSESALLDSLIEPRPLAQNKRVEKRTKKMKEPSLPLPMFVGQDEPK